MTYHVPAPDILAAAPGDAPPVPGISLRDLVRIGFQYKRAVAVIVAAAVLGAFAYVTVAPPSFRAETKVLVKIGREKLAPLSIGSGGGATVMFNERPENINNEIEILRDPNLMDVVFPDLKAHLEAGRERQGFFRAIGRFFKDVAEQAIDLLKLPLRWLGLSREVTPDEALKDRFLSALSVNFIKETDIILLSFSWGDPDFAAYAVNLYAEAYRRQHIRVHDEGSGTVPFYEEQERRVGDELRAVNGEIDAFLAGAGVADLAGEKQIALDVISDLERRLAGNGVAGAETSRRIEVLDQLHGSGRDWIETPDLGPAQPTALAAIDQSFVTLVGQRNELLTRFVAGAPEVRSLDRQLAVLREQKYTSLRAFFADRLRNLADEARLTGEQLAAARRQVDKLRDLTLGFDALKERRDLVAGQLGEYKQKIERLRVNEDLNARDFTSVSIVTPASPPDVPAAPRKGLIMLLAFGFSLILAAAYAVVAEFFNHTFRTERDVVRVLGLPLAASVPVLGNRR